MNAALTCQDSMNAASLEMDGRVLPIGLNGARRRHPHARAGRRGVTGDMGGWARVFCLAAQDRPEKRCGGQRGLAKTAASGIERKRRGCHQNKNRQNCFCSPAFRGPKALLPEL